MRRFPLKTFKICCNRILFIIFLIIACVIASLTQGNASIEPASSIRLIICPDLSTDILATQMYPDILGLARNGTVGLVSYASTPHYNPLSAIASTDYGEAIELYHSPKSLKGVSLNVHSLKSQILYDMSTYDQQNHRSIPEMILRAHDQSRFEIYSWTDDYSIALAKLLSGDGNYGGQTIPCHLIPMAHGFHDPNDINTILSSLDLFLNRLIASSSKNVVTMLISPIPSYNSRGVWDRLPLMIISGGSYTSGEASSITTRTPGLISNLDIAPTIQRILGEKINPFFTGHPIHSDSDAHPFEDVSKLDHAIALNQRALIPGGALLGVAVSVFAFAGIYAERKRSHSLGFWRFGILCMMTMPVSMLLIAEDLRKGDIINVQGYICTLFGIMALIGLAVTLTSKLLLLGKTQTQTSEIALSILALLTVGVLALDSFTGQTMVKFALISGYQLTGIRFYGIGNEFMGFFIGMSLLGVFLIRPPTWLAFCIFCLCTLILVAPPLGAKAGAALVCFVAYGVALFSLKERQLRWKTIVILLCLGVILIFAIGMMEKYLFPHHVSHIGAALESLHARGYGYFAEIILRKVMMNIRLSASPGMIATYVGLVLAWMVKKRDIQQMVSSLRKSHPQFHSALPAVGYGSLVALIFNDSGVVAAIFILSVFISGGIYLLWSPHDRMPNH